MSLRPCALPGGFFKAQKLHGWNHFEYSFIGNSVLCCAGLALFTYVFDRHLAQLISKLLRQQQGNTGHVS